MIPSSSSPPLILGYSVVVVVLNMKVSSINALALAGMAVTTKAAFVVDSQDIEFGNPWWFVYAGISCFLVLFAGIMSGLTLGLMSLGLVELEILQRSGTSTEKRQAGSITLPTSSLSICRQSHRDEL